VKPWVLAVVAVIGSGSAAAALQDPPVQVVVSAGRVSVSATDALVADVLTAWARAGDFEVRGADHLGARRISIRLTNSDESATLSAIVGSPGWYTTVARDTPLSASESTFRRIVILPAAAAAARASSADIPESRYVYASDPEADARAAAMFALPPAPDVKRRPPDVLPESFYKYDDPAPDPPDALKALLTPPEISREPLHPTLGVIPEVLYTYSPTPQPADPGVTSAIIPPTPDLVPEARYTYDPTPEIPAYMLPKGLVVPNIPVFEGWTGLRLPGRTIRYVLPSL
jgi:hypothetical protein